MVGIHITVLPWVVWHAIIMQNRITAFQISLIITTPPPQNCIIELYTISVLCIGWYRVLLSRDHWSSNTPTFQCVSQCSPQAPHGWCGVGLHRSGTFPVGFPQAVPPTHDLFHDPSGDPLRQHICPQHWQSHQHRPTWGVQLAGQFFGGLYIELKASMVCSI